MLHSNDFGHWVSSSCCFQKPFFGVAWIYETKAVLAFGEGGGTSCGGVGCSSRTQNCCEKFHWHPLLLYIWAQFAAEPFLLFLASLGL
eukprot:1745374-Amphidinium_carterae.1